MDVADLNKNKLSVYPNPTSDYLKINSSEKISSVLVYDLSGKNIPVQFDGQAVNVQPLAKGTYMIGIKIGTEVNVQKFIKK